MKSNNFRNRIGKVLLPLSFIAGIGLVSSSAVQAQWDRDRDNSRNQDRNYRRDQDRNRDNRRDRDYDRNRDNRRNDQYGRNGGYGGYGNNGGYGGYGNTGAVNQGYQDGLYTGANDAQRGQNYDPQRSHFYRNGHGDNGNYGNNGRYGNGYGYSQAYRDGFLRGYDEGFRRYGGNRRNNGNYGRRWPF